MYLSLHCHHQNDFCIKMGSDESHFNVSVGSDGQSHRTVSTNHNLFEEKGEPKRVSNRGPSAYQPNAIPLGQTGSHFASRTFELIYYPENYKRHRQTVSHVSVCLARFHCDVHAQTAVKITVVHTSQCLSRIPSFCYNQCVCVCVCVCVGVRACVRACVCVRA